MQASHGMGEQSLSLRNLQCRVSADSIMPGLSGTVTDVESLWRGGLLLPERAWDDFKKTCVIQLRPLWRLTVWRSRFPQLDQFSRDLTFRNDHHQTAGLQIGRASCRERV